MVGDGAFERWIALEMGRMRDAYVTQARPLADLLLEEQPTARTRGGATHAFDRRMLERFHDLLSPLTRRRLRLPATFHVDKDAPDSAFLSDEAAIALVRALGEVPEALGTREGRLWISHARARDIADRHPGAFQFSYM